MRCAQRSTQFLPSRSTRPRALESYTWGDRSPSRNLPKCSTVTEPVLIDANVLIALSFADHLHHERAVAWLGSRRTFATTPSVQGSLIRFAVRVASPTHAGDLIDLLAAHGRHVFWPDDVGYTRSMLRGVTGHSQVTDAYLAEIAVAHATRLATFDQGLAALRPDAVELVA